MINKLKKELSKFLAWRLFMTGKSRSCGCHKRSMLNGWLSNSTWRVSSHLYSVGSPFQVEKELMSFFKEGNGRDGSSPALIYSWQFNVCHDLYQVRNCSRCKRYEQVSFKSKERTLGSCQVDSQVPKEYVKNMESWTSFGGLYGFQYGRQTWWKKIYIKVPIYLCWRTYIMVFQV